MKIGDPLRKILNKKYEPDMLINRKMGKYDIAFKTDEAGNPVSAFVGTMEADGQIKGDRFVRVMVRDAAGQLVKDHWEGKGRT